MKNSDKIEKYCKYCEKAKTLSDPDRMLCEKRGIVSAGYSCRLFRYDPLKRTPKISRPVPSAEFIEI
ncbi:MAG: hypothetical protein IKI93_09910 [Clostridia bacterium]|nr:hypothetical protein [Clostridia bacterium]